MGKRESYEPGTFCWVDLATSDAEGAKSSTVVCLAGRSGTTRSPAASTRSHGDAIGAIGQQDEHPPHWNNYVSVTSADETVARAKRLGARVLEEPFDVAGFGRLAVFADPAGAVLCVWEPRSHIGAARVNDVGCMGWNELQTSDPEAAGNFYGGLFGWEAEPIEDDGNVVYTTIKNAGNQNGGFMPMTEQHGDAPSFWLPYFTVSSRDATMERARELGGTVFAGPLDLPSGKIAVLGDPQGAAFAIFEGETDD